MQIYVNIFKSELFFVFFTFQYFYQYLLAFYQYFHYIK